MATRATGEVAGQPDSHGSSDASVTWGWKEVVVGSVVIALLYFCSLLLVSAVQSASSDDSEVGPMFTVVMVAVSVVMVGVSWLILRLLNMPRGYFLPVSVGAFVIIGGIGFVAPSGGFANSIALFLPSASYFALVAYVVYNIAAGEGGWAQAVRKIRLGIPRNLNDYLWALGICAITWIALRVWTQGLILINAPDWLLVPDNASAALDTYGILLLVLLSVVLASVSEEVAFRGLIFKGLVGSVGFLGAALISSLLFSLIHFQAGIGIFPATFILAMGMVWIYHKTNSMVLTIGAHSLNNAITIFIVVAFGTTI